MFKGKQVNNKKGTRPILWRFRIKREKCRCYDENSNCPGITKTKLKKLNRKHIVDMFITFTRGGKHLHLDKIFKKKIFFFKDKSLAEKKR